jgi:hyaluronate lyase
MKHLIPRFRPPASLRRRLCAVSLGFLAGASFAFDPVPPDQVPGEGVAGRVVVDDGDPAVAITSGAEPSHAAPPPENSPTHGGTTLVYNGWNQVGDGQTTLTVSPELPPGRYAVWVRFLRLARVYHGNADRAEVVVHAEPGDRRYACSPRQGGQWVLLGVHPLTGKGAALSMTNADMKGVAGFDAAVFVPVRAPQPRRPPRRLPPEGSGFATVVRRAADIAIGPTDTVPRDTVVASRLRARDFKARLAWDTLIRDADRTRLWGDNLATSSHTLTSDADRIAAMAAAWAGAAEIDGPGMRGNPRLLADTLAALDTFLTHRWAPQTKWDVNWWDFEIGVPGGVMAALCVLQGEVPPALCDKAFASMARFTEDPWKMYDKGFNTTGANRVWMVRNHIRRAALAGDTAGLERCRDGLTDVFAYVDEDPARMPKSRDGWWRDGSFVQHGHLPYVGAYGVLLIPGLVECMALLEGTPWAVTTPKRANLAEWVDLHLLPVAYEGEVFPRTTGRTQGSSGVETAHEWLAIALAETMPLLPRGQAAGVAARLKRWMRLRTLDESLNRADFAQFMRLHALRHNPRIQPAGPYAASRFHAAVDLAAHHRPGWAATVSMSSTRTSSHEALWGANRRGWNQGEGVLQVWAGDPLRYRHGYWALVDPYRLPGTTVNTWDLPDHDGGGFSPGRPSRQAFVGGVSLDDTATVAAMRVGRDWSSLEARKSWFFLPQGIVCLGSGIAAQEKRPCETIVESALLADASWPLTVDGRHIAAGAWRADLSNVRSLHLGGAKPEHGIGWWFPKPQADLAGERSHRKGAWCTVHKGDSETPIEHDWLTLTVHHGAAPGNAEYQYAVFPGVTAEALARFAAQPSIAVPACTPAAHGIVDRANGISGAVLWEAGARAGPVAADQPCVVLLQATAGEWSVAVADPTQALEQLVLTLDIAAGAVRHADPGITVTPGRPLAVVVDLKHSLGNARTVRFARP